MKEVTKVYSKIKNVLKDTNITIWVYDKDENEFIYETQKKEQLLEALKKMGLPPEAKALIETLNYHFEFIVQEIANAAHQDMLDLWDRLDALEERIE